MKKSIDALPSLLESLQSRARALGLTDTAWAARAGIRKETLSRIRARSSCDFTTLQSLAEAVGAGIGVLDNPAAGLAGGGRFPERFNRDDEDRLLELCASGDLEVQRWRRLGSPIFVAGLAVMVASLRESERRSLLELAEQLHAGSSQVEVFAEWLEQSPVRPSRFLPMLSMRLNGAA